MGPRSIFRFFRSHAKSIVLDQVTNNAEILIFEILNAKKSVKKSFFTRYWLFLASESCAILKNEAENRLKPKIWFHEKSRSEIYRGSGSEWEIYRGSVRIMKSKINNILLLSVLFRNSLFLDKESSIEKQEKSKKTRKKNYS